MSSNDPTPDISDAQDESLRCVRVTISGRVQGVAFRAYTREEAQRQKLGGWVRNLPSGQVEALFVGPSEIIDAMVDWCWHGSPYARVSDVIALDEPIDKNDGNPLGRFEIRH